jgi:hypothetical protein
MLEDGSLQNWAKRNGHINATKDECMKLLWSSYRQYCSSNGIKSTLRVWSLDTLGLSEKTFKSQYATLSSRMKASHVKTMMFFCVDVAKMGVDSADPMSELRCVMIWSLASFIEILDACGVTLPPTKAMEAVRAGKVFLRSYQELALHMLASRRKRFKIRPKLHYFHHLLLKMLERARRGLATWNPARWATWLNEDLMGKLGRIARACHGGSNSKTTTMRRYILLISLMWRRQQK